MSAQAPGKRAGRVLMFVAWGAGLFLATRFFGQWEKHQENPNAVVTSEQHEGYVEVKLLGNGQGHFVATGQINGRPVEFMLDTGATDVAVPAELADRLGLKRGMPVGVSTANGRTQGFRTELGRLQLGDIVLQDVRALVVPGLGDDQVLLGMSALKQLEFTQRSGTLLLRQTKQ
ncbi:TIGR02281 family clan AA aspartic protease [Pseudomonas yamanorum]|jgi:aspartyl protease family protein|uniref:TIGR02281 family clan AA aspartic protease n=1 Tax=Pseudomonas yamanorum TaxID=515393 RepID=A0A7Y8FCT4_9PSED|nr:MULTISPECIES: TIGR02281 family clan AA aspartic protease [Pseudomonas]MCS3415613.1 aspartyl protease family protein [Pseudomonas sp. BIGb0558]MCS3434980.1 aspartyl protease family protein [Pseudomonas sp. BIGb0450]NVZ81904.1 TIGR02281 family clan AA aspartic protease [Pseudomonas yamanorum]NWE38249.1 TIGR02281 family clan AA aspartic protease [Pseudomonas yamanorum]NWE76773.1 TIGR02281 family clan AA aspartic protease [Pseudomonas yamanorum]